MGLGFKRAGIVFDLAFDFSADACASYEANLEHRPIQIDVRDLLRMMRAGASLGRIDLLVADPPCTPWSRAGKRKGLDDERDALRESCELIALLRPTCWLIGNVPGLDDSTNDDAVTATIGNLSTLGYDVDYQKLNASSYGVPQHRIRPFWFGRPRGTERLRWPEPTHGTPGKLALPGLGLLPWVSKRSVICAYSKRWISSEEFTAHTKAVAVRKARPLVVALINASAARWEAVEAEASDAKLAARLRSIRIDTSEGWK